MRIRRFRSFLSDAARIAAWNLLGSSIHTAAYSTAGVVIKFGSDVRVGCGSALAGEVELAASGRVEIGANVTVSGAGVVESIIVEDDCWIAQGAVLLPGVRVARGAVVGAYAVVPGDVAPRSIVVGNPPRHVRWRDDFERFIPADVKRLGVLAREPILPTRQGGP